MGLGPTRSRARVFCQEFRVAEKEPKQVPLTHAIVAAIALFAGGGGMGTALGGSVGKAEFERVVDKLDTLLVEVGNLRVKVAEGSAGTSTWRRDIERRLEKLEGGS